jgi:hypothetical protein
MKPEDVKIWFLKKGRSKSVNSRKPKGRIISLWAEGKEAVGTQKDPDRILGSRVGKLA